MRFESAVFWGFSALILITIFASLAFHPESGEMVYVMQVVIIVGGLCGWSAFAAWRLGKGKGIVAASLLAGYLTQVVLVGWANDGSLMLETAHPVLGILRAANGCYLILLWCAIAWGIRRRRLLRQGH